MKLLLAAVAAAVVAGGASGATLKAQYAGLAQNTGTYHIALNYGSGTLSENVGAGALKHQVTNDSETFAGVLLKTFCVDLAQFVVGQVKTYNIVDVATAPDPDAPTGNVGALRAGYLQSLYYNAIQAGLLDHRGSAADAMTNQQASAFQLVVWELAFEDAGILAATVGSGSYTSLLATDDFVVSSGITAGVASNIETFFEWAFNGDHLSNLRAISSETAQDQLIVIPLPTTGGLALAGLAGVAGIRRRR